MLGARLVAGSSMKGSGQQNFCYFLSKKTDDLMSSSSMCSLGPRFVIAFNARDLQVLQLKQFSHLGSTCEESKMSFMHANNDLGGGFLFAFLCFVSSSVSILPL